MSKTSCEILFENNNTNKVFYGGDTIKGSVIITLHKEKIIKGKRMLFACFAYLLVIICCYFSTRFSIHCFSRLKYVYMRCVNVSM